ncbi:fasciclin domain-containing protein [Flavobacterium sp. 5]|uniref:fasciclin domain-containing protein n=1 Tax=Flavobacterium sp. 5 TaxID=2035199 RepID=UPI000C2B5E86|nr:fasciclin domain-containing protein [Flavobacterium sp. 5]PKB17823.1 putative surface protein with fasciclin (FAS1) repeats [Flavobacterium sp. 5]
MKIIYKLKQIALCTLLMTFVASCDDSTPEIGGTAQNYSGSAFGLVKQNSNLSVFYKAIELTNLTGTLDTDGDFTYFVPSDAAMNIYLVNKGFVNDLGYPDIALVPVEQLKQIVLSHIIKGTKKRVGPLEGVTADYLETGDYTTMANEMNPALYLLSVVVNGNILKVNGSDKQATGIDIYAVNGFVHVLDNVINLTPPPPVISSLSQVFASPGDIITLYGDNFVGIKSVKFNDTEAEIIGTSTRYEMKAKVPDDFGTSALIVVETEFGTSSPSSIGVKYLFYGDDFSGNPTPSAHWGWGGDYVFQSTKNVSRGTYSIEKIAGPWSGFHMGFEAPLNVADYQFLKISVYATESTKILVSINSDDTDANGTTVTLVAGQWNNLSIPFSDLKTDKIGTTFNSLFIKEYSGISLTPGSTIYLDDIGFL